VDVPCDEPSVDRFIQQLGQSLNLPDYFGQNRDALDECLRDLSWFEEHEIILWHCKLPSIPDDQLRVYLSVLQCAAEDWSPGESHRLVPMFDVECQSAIQRLLTD
jgi:hypothetical protein